MTGNDEAETLERLIHLGHVSSGVGHHVINAFSAIVSNAEMLRLKTPIRSSVDPAALAETIIQSALGAATVARRLIDYSRPVTSVEPDRAAFEPHALSLEVLVAGVIDAERRGPRNGTTWETDLVPVPRIRGHDTQLRSMLTLLLQNAYEALLPEGGTVSVSTSIDDRGWNVLDVCDSGQGMPPEVLVRAVEPFFSTKPGHIGVGLSIANGIWRRHRGTVSIQSQPGDGTRVRLCVEPSRE